MRDSLVTDIVRSGIRTAHGKPANAATMRVKGEPGPESFPTRSRPIASEEEMIAEGTIRAEDIVVSSSELYRILRTVVRLTIN